VDGDDLPACNSGSLSSRERWSCLLSIKGHPRLWGCAGSMLAVEALAVVPLLHTMGEGIAEWTATAAAQTPVYRAITSLLEELPPDLRAKLPRLGVRFAEELEPTMQPEVATAIRVWSAAHPEEAQALSAAANDP